MENQKDKQLVLPKNIRQIGTFGDTYKIYVEDFVYTYVHQFLHQKKEENEVIAAVLLGEVIRRDGVSYVFVSGAQKVDFRLSAEGEVQEDSAGRQQEFWGKVYQGIKEYFSDRDILGWYINLDGSSLELNQQLQQFFEATYSRGSHFLYYEDSLEKLDAFFVQEQHTLQRISGYAVYYEKNPQMQEFMIAEKERQEPKMPHNVVKFEKKEEDVAQNYRAIMNKLNEKPPKKKVQPVIYVAGVAVLAIVTATGVTQIGNYQNLRTLESTLQTLSGSVSGNTVEDAPAQEGQEQDSGQAAKESNADSVENPSASDEMTTQPEQEESAQSETDKNPEAEDTSVPLQEAEPEQAAESTAAASGEDAVQTESGQAVPTDNTQEPVYYTVQKGDSLVSISRSMYHTTDMIEEICSLNNIENMDVIYEGQKLLMP